MMQAAPRAIDGRAPDIFRAGGWMPMRCHRNDDEVDFLIVGAGAGGATLACKLSEAGCSVVVLEAGPFWRPLDDFASDEESQQQLYWTDERLSCGDDPLALGGNNSGRGVGGSTVHFSMISLRFRPAWFRARSQLGYGFDWPLDYDELAPYYAEAEEALKISGPVRYPWGPPRRRYPYREHEMNAAGLVLARGAEALGVPWAAVPLATVSAPRGASPPCVYRGFCNFGCSTNAKQSALVVWIPRALRAGAEVRDLAMAGRIELDGAGRAAGVHYWREGRWQFLRHRNAASASQFRLQAIPPRPGQQLGAGRHPPHHACRTGRMGALRGGDPLVQGPTQHGRLRALELYGRRQGLPGRVRLHEPGPAAARLGPDDSHLARALGHGLAPRNAGL